MRCLFAALCLTLLAAPSLLAAPGDPEGYTPTTGCWDIADYADEIVVTAATHVATLLQPDGRVELQFDIAVINNERGAFSNVQPWPQLVPLGLDAEVLRAGSVRNLQPYASGSNEPLLPQRILVDAADEQAVIAAIEGLAVDHVVRAEETPQYVDNVVVLAWDPADFPLCQTGECLAPLGREPSVRLEAIADPDPGYIVHPPAGMEVYAVEDPAVVYPQRLDPGIIGRLDSYEYNLASRWQVNIVAAPLASDDIGDRLTAGSGCSGPGLMIDPDIAITRLPSVDGQVQDPYTISKTPQPIRFNDVMLGDGLSVSGQLSGYVLKPRLEIRVRGNDTRVIFHLENDLTASVQLEASKALQLPRVDQTLLNLCFPLPTVAIGSVPIPVALGVVQRVGFEGEVEAGMTVGLHKQIKGEVMMGYDAARPVGERFFYDHHGQSTPFELSSPKVTDSTSLHAEVVAGFDTKLYIGTSVCGGLGAGVTTEATLGLDVTPAQSPWWSASASVVARGELSLGVLGLDVVNRQTGPLQLVPPQTRDGPPAPGNKGLKADANPGQSGLNQRWAVAIEDTFSDSFAGVTAVATLSDGGVVLTTSSPASHRWMLIHVDEHGRLKWARLLQNTRLPLGVDVLADDTIVVGGGYESEAFLAWFDPDTGAALTTVRHDLYDATNSAYGCVIESFEAFSDAQGNPRYVMAGWLEDQSVQDADGCAAVFNDTGALVWARSYDQGHWEKFSDVTPTQDGGFVFAGKNYADHGVDKQNPWLVKVNGAGDLVWAHSLPVADQAELWGVDEAPDGTLWFVGDAVYDVVLSGATGGMFAGWITPDGSEVRHATFLQDELADSTDGVGTWVDTGGGSSIYDTGRGIVATEDGAVFVGATDEDNERRAMWVTRVGKNLGVQWHLTVDGVENDRLDRIAAADDGFIVAGPTRSLTPFGVGSNDRSIFLAKLPPEGRMAPRPFTGLVARYVTPGVRATSTDDSVTRGPSLLPTAPVVTDLGSTTLSPIGNLLQPTPTVCLTPLTTTGLLSADGCTHDLDGDGVDDLADTCPLTFGPSAAEQADLDGDGLGAVCDPDDGVLTDAGVVDGDAGVAELDAGVVGSDAGAPVDGGAVMDGGTTVVDAGPPEEDAGQRVDAGLPPAPDAGPTMIADAGAPGIDAGSPPVGADAGAVDADAGAMTPQECACATATDGASPIGLGALLLAGVRVGRRRRRA